MSDLIERQAALECFHTWIDRNGDVCTPDDMPEYRAIEALPSVELEPLTDIEQRIFLAAMAREEKICKEVDEECRDCREPYEDSLVRTCHEIIRKAKGALWTI